MKLRSREDSSFFKSILSLFKRQEQEEAPLYIAIINRDTTAVAALLAAGADPNATAKNGMTMLMYAAYMNEVEAARLLLDHGAEINATIRDGTTALHYTQESLRGNIEVMRLLLERGANVDAATEDGYNALVSAVVSPYKVNAVRILLQAGADIHHQSDGRSVLQTALLFSRGKETEAISLLREAGA
ncbi:MAG: ankyrin repeat domain-containing protein [Armatimonadota bacterium]